MYLLLIDTYVKDPGKKNYLLCVIKTVPCTQRKAQWALKWCDATTASFAECMIAFAAVEGIFFLGSFCAIFWLKKQGLMPGLCFSNKLISCNEGLHCNFACLLYSKLVNRLPESHIVYIISSADNIEMEFVINTLPVELIGMNSPIMCNYIKFCADRLLVTLGCQRHYKTGNPFEWMEMISLQGKPISLRNVLESMLNRESVLKIWLKSSATMSVSKPQFIRPTYSTILFMNTLFPCPLSPRLYGKQKSMWKNQETLNVQ